MKSMRIFFAAAAVLCAASCGGSMRLHAQVLVPSHAPADATFPTTRNNAPANESSSGDVIGDRMAAERVRLAIQERRKSVQNKVSKLQRAVAELKTQLDLPEAQRDQIAVVKMAERVEKLARSLRHEMTE